MTTKKWLALLLHAIGVWAICGAIMFIGMGTTTIAVTLTVHAVGAPIASALLAFQYHRRYGDLPPLMVGLFFVSVALLLDFFLVAMVIEKSFEMFTSIIGLWLPMIFIFSAAYITGNYVKTHMKPT